MEQSQPDPARRKQTNKGCRRIVRFFVRAFVVLTVVFCVLAGLLIWRGSLAPALSRDFAGELASDWADLPQSDLAWPLLIEAIRADPLPPRFLLDTAEDDADLEYGPYFGSAPEDEGWDEVEAYLRSEQAQASLAIVRRAAERPALGYRHSRFTDPDMLDAGAEASGLTLAHPEIVANAPLMHRSFVHLAVLRRAGRMLRSDSFVAAAEGDTERIIANVRTKFRLARFALREPFLSDHLAGIAIELSAMQEPLEVLDRYPEFGQRAFLDEMISIIDEHEASRPMLPRFDGQAMIYADHIQRLYTDRGNGDGVLTSRGLRYLREQYWKKLFGLVVEDKEAEIRRMQRNYTGAWRPWEDTVLALSTLHAPRLRDVQQDVDNAIDANAAFARLPPWSAWHSPERARLQGSVEVFENYAHVRTGKQGADGELTIPLVKVFDESGVSAFNWRAEYELDAVRFVLLNLAHAATHGRPMSQEEAAPLLPTDPFTGQPARYALADGAWTLYWFGIDGDDDHARHAESAGFVIPPENAQRVLADDPEEWEGDFVLWPIPQADEDDADWDDADEDPDWVADDDEWGGPTGDEDEDG